MARSAIGPASMAPARLRRATLSPPFAGASACVLGFGVSTTARAEAEPVPLPPRESEIGGPVPAPPRCRSTDWPEAPRPVGEPAGVLQSADGVGLEPLPEIGVTVVC